MSGYNKANVIKVDKQKFYAVLKAHDMDAAKLSEELGHTRTYLYHYVGHTKGIPKFVVNHLQKWYGIKYEEYEYTEPKEDPKPAAEPKKDGVVEIDTEALIKALKTALTSYAWQQAIAQTVRFVLREEPTEDMIRKIIHEAIEEKLG